MGSRRTARIAEAIRETVSSTVLFDLRDPRIKNVTVISADVAPDLRSAKVYVSVMGDEKTQALSMHGLNAARGYVQSKVADRLQTRYTPILKFVLDQGIKKSIEASRILRELGENPDAAADSTDDHLDDENAWDDESDEFDDEDDETGEEE